MSSFNSMNSGSRFSSPKSARSHYSKSRSSSPSRIKNPREGVAGKTSLASLGMAYATKGPNLSLDNFNEESTAKIILNSPRSIQSCLELGISARDLIKRPLHYFAEKGVDRDIIEMRWQHYETKRKDKLSQARQKRQELIFDDAHDDEITAIEYERQRVESIKEKNRQHLQKSLLIQLQQKEKQLEKERKLQQEKKLEEERLKKLQIAREREERIRKENEQALQQKLQMMEEFKKRRIRSKQEKLIEKEARAAEAARKLKQRENHKSVVRRRYNQQRFQVAKYNLLKKEQRQQAVLTSKLQTKELKLSKFEAKKAQLRRIQDLKAQEKDKTISDVKLRSKIIEENRKEEIISKRNQKNKIQEQRNKIAEIKSNKSEELKKLREQRYHEIQMTAKLQEKKRVQESLASQKERERLLHRQMNKNQKSQALRLERLRLKELDRQDAINRTKRIEEFQRLQQEQKILAKERRTQRIQEERNLAMERSHHAQQMVAKSKALLEGFDLEALKSTREAIESARRQSQNDEEFWEEVEIQLASHSPMVTAVSSRRGSRNSTPNRKSIGSRRSSSRKSNSRRESYGSTFSNGSRDPLPGE